MIKTLCEAWFAEAKERIALIDASDHADDWKKLERRKIVDMADAIVSDIIAEMPDTEYEEKIAELAVLASRHTDYFGVARL